MSLCGKIIQHLMQNKFVAADVIGLTDSARLGNLDRHVMAAQCIWTPANNRCFLIFLCGGFAIFMAKSLIPKKDPMVFAFNGCDVRECDVAPQSVPFLHTAFNLCKCFFLVSQGNFATRDRGQL